MKIKFLILGILFTSFAFSQTHKIVKHNGEQLDVNYIKQDNDLLYYSLNGSMEQFTISKYAVSSLNENGSSKSESISPKIIVSNKKDYSSVKVLKPSQTIGLKEVEIFSGMATKTKGESPLALREQTERRIKTKSADNGYPFVSIVEKPDGKYQAVAYIY
ncbi:hypothetical protein OIU83_18625 [Flavobacterium sp. LS1R49]|uniref:Uncharacterized protein n=1 Tax=Flavobacterium shii TaxID=2987687 RepID=A0A9X3C535_9FLAO|nr:hypothetical protein [Flavobacterium shii]MCV9929684.1 hypothetical protein [Flavobacterium shii]